MYTLAPVSNAAIPRDGDARSFGILSTFPPTECGIATFSAALAAGLIANGATVDVVRCGAPYPVEYPVEDVSVLGALAAPESSDFQAPLDVLNGTDVAIVQHEYGLYGGLDGDEILNTIIGIEVPVIVVAHTVLSAPTTNQRWILEELCKRADAVVVMTETARIRLTAYFDVDASKVIVIPHGAATPPGAAPTPEADLKDRVPRLLTWGLLGPGKGIEWAIDAMADLSDLRPRPQYTVAGATHPKVLARSGQAYRNMLVQRAASSAAAAQVSFDDTYRDLASLTELIRAADLVVLPYDSTDQVTSGVLVDAVAAGRPVVSTAFPHAVELLGSGAGLVVPQRDTAALAAAIRSVLSDHGLAQSMAAEARRLAPDLAWTAVAARYGDLARRLLARRQPVQR
ncbi:MAG: glycosyltransferase [Acidimicrobiia bacterium]|nr:glycosyltransferase [Acidimicrobiia bacterium]MDH5520051.1 glycosyltransferase [Acidimicrobiia bacterium]